MPTTATTTQPDPICPTESQLALLGRIAQRAETGCPMTYREVREDGHAMTDLMGLWDTPFIGFRASTGEYRATPAGHAALQAGLATKQCFADGCDASFTFEPEGEEVSYCSERCEAAREGL